MQTRPVFSNAKMSIHHHRPALREAAGLVRHAAAHVHCKPITSLAYPRSTDATRTLSDTVVLEHTLCHHFGGTSRSHGVACR